MFAWLNGLHCYIIISNFWCDAQNDLFNDLFIMLLLFISLVKTAYGDQCVTWNAVPTLAIVPHSPVLFLGVCFSQCEEKDNMVDVKYFGKPCNQHDKMSMCYAVRLNHKIIIRIFSYHIFSREWEHLNKVSEINNLSLNILCSTNWKIITNNFKFLFLHCSLF